MAVSTSKTHPESSPAGQQAKTDAQAADPSLAEVQAIADKETAQGFRGVEADPTPNENYTVAGVIAGAPTPETDVEHAKTVRDHLLGVETKAAGVAAR